METRKQSPREAYKVDGIYEFRVRKQFPTYCEVIDELTDITTYLRGTANLKLFKGQTVRCRILSIKEKHPRIELVDISEFEQNKANLNEEKLTELLSKRELTWNTKEFIRLLLTEENEKSFESQCHRWIQNLINKKIDLNTVRMDCSDILELSELLDLCSDAEREYYQERLTTVIEQLGYYVKAAELIANEADKSSTDTPTYFINALFNKLQISGFVYHPTKNFNILASLFLRRPELMNSRIKELLDIICQRNIDSWKKEPFNSAIIKLLELYIRECDGRIDKTKDNLELIKNNMQALALQLLLHQNPNDNTIADYRLNTARLCIISSYLYPLHPDWLVDMAYFYLFHSNAHLMNYTMDNIGLIPHYIASLYPGSKIDTVNSFSQNKIKLMVSAEGIQLFSSGADNTMKPVFPKDLGLWQGLQVFLSGKTSINLNTAKPNDITPYQKVWEEIEDDLFNSASTITTTAAKTKKQHRTNEIVRISFIRQDASNHNKYWCKIEDEIGGDGYIYVNDIVPYTINTSLRHFLAPDGSRYVFEARIIDDENGVFHFSMLKEMKDAALDYYTYDEDIICSVGGTSIQGGLAPAVSKEGISVSLKNASDFEGIGKNTIVKCRLLGRGTGTFHIQCEITEITAYDFDMTSAFRNLMEDYSVGKISENISSQEEEDILESDRVLDESYVREVIFLIDRMAIIDKDYVKSYNYLAFARTLCMLIGWESQAAYYKGRMDIITMLHYFARNSKVEEEKLEQLENVNAELFSNNVILRDRFLQLQAVSFLDRPEHNEDLFEVAKNNPSLKELASLVLAYNITKESKMESTATDIHNRIKQQLNLKGFETGLKLYGTGEETIDTEYKTSLVFPAGKSFTANPDKQMEEIMKVVNSFLNTIGGTLYVGVNDYGLGTGVEEDLNYTLYHGDKDKYLRAIPDAMSLKWGNSLSTTYIEDIRFDTSNHDKDILMVKIRPHQMGVPFDGFYYVRVGSTKRKLTKEEFAEYQRLNRRLPEQVEAETKPVAELPQEQDKPVMTAPLVTSKEDEVRTSRIRKNVLAEYLDPENYVEPVAFFKFLGNGKFRKLDEYDYDDQSLLTLTVLEHEVKSWLILGYDNGHVTKVSVEELMEYQPRDYARYAEAKLIFASIANDDDAILTISRENKTKPKVVMRMDTISTFEEGKLMDDGELPFNEKLASEFLAFDIIPARYKHQFDGILDKIKSFVGYPQNTVTKPMVNALHLWGINEI
jgi:hypothetical protein